MNTYKLTANHATALQHAITLTGTLAEIIAELEEYGDINAAPEFIIHAIADEDEFDGIDAGTEVWIRWDGEGFTEKPEPTAEDVARFAAHRLDTAESNVTVVAL